MPQPLRLMIADDHALFRQGLRSMLQLEDDVKAVREIERADEIASALAASPCDILLLDLQMERSVLDDISALAREVQVVVVTADEWPETALEALRRGARAVVLKRFAIETLMDAIRAVAQGQVWLPPELQSAMMAEWRSPSRERLTEREREVVRYVALGLRNAEVAQRLRVSEPTVKSHLTNIFQKLGLRDRVEVALFAFRVGLVRPHEGPR